MVRRVPAVEGEDALGVGHEGAARVDAERQRPVLEHGLLRHRDAVVLLGVEDEPVARHAIRLEVVLGDAAAVRGLALRGARRGALRLLEVLRARAVGEVGAALRGGHAVVALHVLEHLVLPAAAAPIGVHAGGGVAAAEHGVVAHELAVGVDAHTAVGGAQSREDPAAAAVALVVHTSDDPGALGPAHPRVEDRRHLLHSHSRPQPALLHAPSHRPLELGRDVPVDGLAAQALHEVDLRLVDHPGQPPRLEAQAGRVQGVREGLGDNGLGVLEDHLRVLEERLPAAGAIGPVLGLRALRHVPHKALPKRMPLRVRELHFQAGGVQDVVEELFCHLSRGELARHPQRQVPRHIVLCDVLAEVVLDLEAVPPVLAEVVVHLG
mmetsp:Transcript_119442/g.334569  ORF Transcript_119442/g.334569 Transcript_119442/m.334569 type:complete len:380 (+) Transcript_119442:669-1808(+)